MYPLLCRASSFSSSSSGKTSGSKNVVNSEEFVIEDFNKVIDNWELPKISKEMIYKTKNLDFLKNDKIWIKTTQGNFSWSCNFPFLLYIDQPS